eukprot:13674783-Alexandrium_andersonii.AAC.1
MSKTQPSIHLQPSHSGAATQRCSGVGWRDVRRGGGGRYLRGAAEAVLQEGASFGGPLRDNS